MTNVCSTWQRTRIYSLSTNRHRRRSIKIAVHRYLVARMRDAASASAAAAAAAKTAFLCKIIYSKLGAVNGVLDSYHLGSVYCAVCEFDV